eukprot:568581-Prymnesium_polylepis.1
MLGVAFRLEERRSPLASFVAVGGGRGPRVDRLQQRIVVDGRAPEAWVRVRLCVAGQRMGRWGESGWTVGGQSWGVGGRGWGVGGSRVWRGWAQGDA